MAAPWTDEPRPCGDPECPGTAEPESDGDLRYYACTLCGFESGWEMAGKGSDGTCSIGIPEQVRRRASIPPEPVPVFLGASIGRRPA